MPCRHLQSNIRDMILGHCHVGPRGYFKRVWGEMKEEDGDFEHLARYLGETGYGKAVVFPPFGRDALMNAFAMEGDPNEWTFKAIAASRAGGPGASAPGAVDDRFIPWMTLTTVEGAAETLRECARKGAKGVKFHPPVTRISPCDPRLDGFYALAEELRMPVLYHTGPHGWLLDEYRPLVLDRVCQAHPKLPVVIEHLGGTGFIREAWAVMQNNRSAYGGLTSCLVPGMGWPVPADEAAAMMREFGADRFLFGSDFPYNGAQATRQAVEALKGFGLPAADLSLVMSGNLERLMGNVMQK